MKITIKNGTMTTTAPNGKTYSIRERKVPGMYGINAEYYADVVARNGRVVFIGTSYQNAEIALDQAIGWLVGQYR